MAHYVTELDNRTHKYRTITGVNSGDDDKDFALCCKIVQLLRTTTYPFVGDGTGRKPGQHANPRNWSVSPIPEGDWKQFPWLPHWTNASDDPLGNWP